MKALLLVLTITALFALASVPTGAATARPDVATLPLGQLTLTTARPDTCPEGFRCEGFVVRCPDVRDDARGYLAIGPKTATSSGVAVFYSGGFGTSWWGAGKLQEAFFRELAAQGIVAVQARWQDSWLVAPAGDPVGPAKLACRPATVAQWVYEHLYSPDARVQPARSGRCGFCLTGNSGGSSQVTYALAFYGLDRIVDVLVPTGGPPHAAIAKGCVADPRFAEYAYNDWAQRTLDASWGFVRTSGPCQRHDASFVQQWERNSVDLGGNDYHYPDTKVRVLVGAQDSSVAPAHAKDYVARLRAAGQDVSYTAIPNTPHQVQSTKEGLAAIAAALLGRTSA